MPRLALRKMAGIMGPSHPPAVEFPSTEQIDAYYKEWFTENYMAPCGKTPPAVLAFCEAMLQKFIAPQVEQG